jgi:hypothetical protein
MAERLSRNELYNLVWSEPLRTLSARFGISDVALRKTCVKAAIPTPERGYWARKDAGHKVVQTALPLRPPGMDDEVVVAGAGKWWYRDEKKEELHAPLPPPPEFPEPIDAVRGRIAKNIGKVSVSKGVHLWHPVIDALLKEDERRREQLRTDPYPTPWNKPRFDTPSERRRLRILNSLFCAVLKMNGSASSGEEKAGHFFVTFYHHNVGVKLVPSQQSRRRARRGTEKVEPPEPGLTMSILESSRSESARFMWRDEDTSKLEDHITEIAIQTALAAEIQYREGALRQHQFRVEHRARMEAEERKRQFETERAERERLRQIEQARIDRLLRDATAFQQADQIRKYVVAIRARVQSDDSLTDKEFQMWSQWALTNADRIDPSVEGAYLAGMREEIGDNA